MKKISCLIILFTIISCTNVYIVITKYDDEISSETRNEIHNLNKKIIKAFKNKNFDFLQENLSNNMFSVYKKDVENYTSNFNTLEYTSLYDCSIYAQTLGSNKRVVIAPLKEKYFIINNYDVIANNSFISFLKSKNEKGTQYLAAFHYILKNKKWILESLHGNIFAIDNMNASDLYIKGMKEYKKNNYINSAMYFKAMTKLLRPIKNIQYKNENVFLKQATMVFQKLNNSFSFPIKLKSNSLLYSIDIALTNHGIVPIFIYKTDTNINNHEQVEKEAKQLYTMICKIFSLSPSTFNNYIMKACNEAPINKNKKYQFYSTIIKK